MSRQFSAVPMAAVDDPAVSDGMLRMLNVLGAYANKDGWCWPRLEVIAKRMGKEKPAISKMLTRLREAGYLEVHYEIREGRRRCVFRVVYDRPVTTAAAIDEAEYEAGLEGEPAVARVSRRETGKEGARVSLPETGAALSFPQEPNAFPSEGNGPLMNRPRTHNYMSKSAHADGAPVISTAAANDIVETWNEMAADARLPKARVTPKRARVIAARLREPGWREDFALACAAIAASPWHRGQNDRGWAATIDFVLQAGKATELAERSSVRPSDARVAGAAGAPGIAQSTVTALWDLCVSGGLTSPMQSRETIQERVQALHASGRVRDREAFEELVFRVQPWQLAEIRFTPERERVLAERLGTLAGWKPQAVSA